MELWVRGSAILLSLASVGMLVGCTASSRGDDTENRPKPAVVATHAEASPTSPQSAKNSNQVVIDNFRFDPPELVVAVGARVTWINHDDVPHTATSTARPKAFDSKSLDTDQQFTHQFSVPGTYEYFCAVHPHMRGKIVAK